MQLFVDFYADWCGPCKMVAPTVEALSNKYPDVTFLKLDVDACPARCPPPTLTAASRRVSVSDLVPADTAKLGRRAATSAPVTLTTTLGRATHVHCAIFS